jgi:hypothetical protein
MDWCDATQHARGEKSSCDRGFSKHANEPCHIPETVADHFHSGTSICGARSGPDQVDAHVVDVHKAKMRAIVSIF